MVLSTVYATRKQANVNVTLIGREKRVQIVKMAITGRPDARSVIAMTRASYVTTMVFALTVLAIRKALIANAARKATMAIRLKT